MCVQNPNFCTRPLIHIESQPWIPIEADQRIWILNQVGFFTPSQFGIWIRGLGL